MLSTWPRQQHGNGIQTIAFQTISGFGGVVSVWHVAPLKGQEAGSKGSRHMLRPVSRNKGPHAELVYKAVAGGAELVMGQLGLIRECPEKYIQSNLSCPDMVHLSHAYVLVKH
ncbi:hypothetical protein GWK47_022222 [Chionoecetes opilio]|uniref:Uncharacterized protein n=1 Tax=Chionoecetes opilio TaxID=41210 RepID=A0A8J5CG99_CHIOP|nr:hypothetical protein GWK47_022222 [Chionoecetes opilio]